jgi:hypothetical protein
MRGIRARVFSVVLTIGMCIHGQANAQVGADDFITIAALLLKLAAEFGTTPVPTVEVDNDPCSLSMTIGSLRGVFGNVSIAEPKVRFNDFWQGRLNILGQEGFFIGRRDRLTVDGSVQHRSDLCDDARANDAGGALNYLIVLDLNEASIQSQIANNRISLDAPEVPSEQGHLKHFDRLRHATLVSAIINNQSDISLSRIEINAGHTKFRIAEPSTPLLLAPFFFALLFRALWVSSGERKAFFS